MGMSKEEKLIEQRYQLLVAMHTLITAMNNEDAYYDWIVLVPDGADDEDLRDIARDKEFMKQVADLFRRLVKMYGNDGFICTVGTDCEVY